MKAITAKNALTSNVPTTFPGKGSPHGKGSTSTQIDNCADAVTKIETALTLARNFMKTSGDKPSLGDIQAVLVLLENSLGSECAEDSNDQKVKRDGILGGPSDDDESSGLLDDILGGGEDDQEEYGLGAYLQHCRCMDSADDEAALACLQQCASSSTSSASENGQKTDSETLTRRETGCSECERQLYNIVHQLQEIFTIGGGLAGPATDLPGVSDIPQIDDTKAAVPAVNATTFEPAQLRRRAIQLARS